MKKIQSLPFGEEVLSVASYRGALQEENQTLSNTDLDSKWILR